MYETDEQQAERLAKLVREVSAHEDWLTRNEESRRAGWRPVDEFLAAAEPQPTGHDYGYSAHS